MLRATERIAEECMLRTHFVWFAAITLCAPSWAFAQTENQHSLQGTIASVGSQRLAVKTATGQSVDLVVDAQTVCVRGEAELAKCDARVGERVVVEFEESGATKTATRLTLPVRPVPAAAQYVCPIHPEVVSDTPGRCLKCGTTLERKRTGI
jgi:hypothetical protein